MIESGPYGTRVRPDGRKEAAFGLNDEEAVHVRALIACGCHPELTPMLGGLLHMYDEMKQMVE